MCEPFLSYAHPCSEQRAIAAVLDSIDEAIERTEEVIAATERLRDALLHELLTRGVPGQHSEWKEAPGIGTIPACWDVVRLGDVVTVRYATGPRLLEVVSLRQTIGRTETFRLSRHGQVNSYSY